jgi:ClpP class serine protease
VRATEAGVFMGQAAVDAKLADAVGTLEAVMSDLKAGKVPLDAAQARLPVPGAAASASWPEQRARIKAILGHESAKACYDAALHAAFETDLPVDQAVAALQISADMVRADAARPSAAPVHAPRLMRDPASDRPLNSAAAMGALSPEDLARRVSGAL